MTDETTNQETEGGANENGRETSSNAFFPVSPENRSDIAHLLEGGFRDNQPVTAGEFNALFANIQTKLNDQQGLINTLNTTLTNLNTTLLEQIANVNTKTEANRVILNNIRGSIVTMIVSTNSVINGLVGDNLLVLRGKFFNINHTSKSVQNNTRLYEFLKYYFNNDNFIHKNYSGNGSSYRNHLNHYSTYFRFFGNGISNNTVYSHNHKPTPSLFTFENMTHVRMPYLNEITHNNGGIGVTRARYCMII